MIMGKKVQLKKLLWNTKNIVIIKHLEINQILTLDNP